MTINLAEAFAGTGFKTLYWWLHSGYTEPEKKKGQPVRIGLDSLGNRMIARFPCVVPGAGIEPARLAAGDFESPASTNFTTRAVENSDYRTASAGDWLKKTDPGSIPKVLSSAD